MLSLDCPRRKHGLELRGTSPKHLPHMSWTRTRTLSRHEAVCVPYIQPLQTTDKSKRSASRQGAPMLFTSRLSGAPQNKDPVPTREANLYTVPSKTMCFSPTPKSKTGPGQPLVKPCLGSLSRCGREQCRILQFRTWSFRILQITPSAFW